jgi:hypothetical protein
VVMEQMSRDKRHSGSPIPDLGNLRTSRETKAAGIIKGEKSEPLNSVNLRYDATQRDAGRSGQEQGGHSTDAGECVMGFCLTYVCIVCTYIQSTICSVFAPRVLELC